MFVGILGAPNEVHGEISPLRSDLLHFHVVKMFIVGVSICCSKHCVKCWGVYLLYGVSICWSIYLLGYLFAVSSLMFFFLAWCLHCVKCVILCVILWCEKKHDSQSVAMCVALLGSKMY